MSIYDPGKRPQCAVCFEELTPADAIHNETEHTYVGFYPCPKHPQGGVVYSGDPDPVPMVTGHPPAPAIAVTQEEVTGSGAAGRDRVTRTAQSVIRKSRQPAFAPMEAPINTLEKLEREMLASGVGPATEEQAREIRKKIARISAIIHNPGGVMIHHLKSWPNYFQAVKDGSKTFEIRNADRDFQVGDILALEEFIPHTPCRRQDENIEVQTVHHESDSPHGCTCGYTGRSVRGRITYVMPGGALNGLPDEGGLRSGYCILGIYMFETAKKAIPAP